MPTFGKYELDVHDYFPNVYTSANFHFNSVSGASLQIREILRFCDFFMVSYSVTGILYCFLSVTLPVGWIFTVHGSYDVLSHNDGHFAVAKISEFIWGNTPKAPEMRMNRQFQAKRAEYKIAISSKRINTINVEF